LLYGATGYTGELIARLAVSRGDRPILAGRDANGVSGLARALGLEHRVFGLDDPKAVDSGLADAGAVLHCAGPFSKTAVPMADACLRTKVHYLDITGEVEVFVALRARDLMAKAAGITLLPGVGFDVVPSDCLAAHLKRRLPSATRLTLGLLALGRLSRGTSNTMLENLPRGGLVRRAGVLTSVPAGWKTRGIDFGRGLVPAVTIPWGDLATAWASTGIPEIEVYLAAPRALRVGLRFVRWFGGLLGTDAVQGLLRRRVRAGARGPSDVERARGRCIVWGEVQDDAGGRAEARLTTPEGYTLTALTALASVKKVLAGEAPAGYQTPSLAFGPDFVLSIEGCSRLDVA
jgi:short subunit dehydrogenase-like uncharacterized protein